MNLMPWIFSLAISLHGLPYLFHNVSRFKSSWHIHFSSFVIMQWKQLFLFCLLSCNSQSNLHFLTSLASTYTASKLLAHKYFRYPLNIWKLLINQHSIILKILAFDSGFDWVKVPILRFLNFKLSSWLACSLSLMSKSILC